MVSAPRTSVPISGAEDGIRAASSDDQDPERKFRVIRFSVRAARKAERISGVSSMSPETLVWPSQVEGGGIRGGEVVVAQVRRTLGRVARRSTEEL